MLPVPGAARMSAPEEAVSLQVTCIALWGCCWLQTMSVEPPSERKLPQTEELIPAPRWGRPPLPLPQGVGLYCSLLGEGGRGRLEGFAVDGTGKEG